jgi:hypothetical protein
MNQKIEITRYTAEQLGLPTDDRSIRNHKRLWWQNLRVKTKGGLRLTEAGYTALCQAKIRDLKVKYDAKFEYNNQFILMLDNHIEVPWYITPKAIYVFNDRLAVQLVLFSGNIERLIRAKIASNLTETTV